MPSPLSFLLAVVDGVGEGGVALGGNGDGEVDGGAVALGVVGGLGGDLPVLCSVHPLHGVDGDGLWLLVRKLDLEALVDDVGAAVDVKVCLATCAG